MGKDSSVKHLMNACPSCGEVMDVSLCDPYSKVICPECSTAIRVRADFLNFRIKKKIGEGGLSRVFRAVDQTLNRQVALKILSPEFSKDSKRAKEFEREARITASISHPNVVKVFSAGSDQEHYFMAMELVSGGSLDRLIHSKGKIVEKRALKIGAEIVNGLQAAQNSGLIHRDVKPGNILFSDEGVSKIVDFGLAKRELNKKTDSEEMWATPYYVPPEKLYGEREDFRSDIYSLGATLFHALSGVPPCSSDTSSIEELKILKQKKISLEVSAPNISIATCELVDRMMEKSPENRHGSYEDLLDDFNKAKNSLSQSSVKLVGASLRVEKNEKSNAHVKMILLLISLLAVVGSLVFLNAKSETVGGSNSSYEVENDDFIYVDISDPKQSVTGKFLAAISMMVESDYGAAERVFGQIASSPESKQPTVNWSLFNQGLSILLQGDLERARSVFQRLEEKSDYTENSEDQMLYRFFRKSSQLLSQRKPISYDQLVNFEVNGYESMALLAFGFQNWEHGDFDDAEEYFQIFTLNDSPDDDYPWIKLLKVLPVPYLKDIELFREFPTLRENPNSNEVLTVLNISDEIISSVSFHKIKEILNSRILNYQRLSEQLVIKETEEEELRMSNLRVKELQKILELRDGVQDYSSDFRFFSGLNLIKLTNFSHPEFIQIHADLIKIWTSSESFVQRIINNINKTAYYGPVTTKEGSLRTLKIISADREFFTYSFGAAQGKAKVPISKISANSLINISISYDKKISDKSVLDEIIKERTLFSYIIGNLSQSAEFSSQISDESFKGLWSRILEFERNK